MYRHIIFSSLLATSLVSCVSYQEKALQKEQIFEELSKEQNEFIQSQNTELSFAQAEALMSTNNLEIAELKALYAQSEALAKIATPIPNPELTAGPEFGSNLGATESSSTQPFVGLAFTIPLNGRLSLADDLKQIAKEQSNLELILKHRELALKLRQTYLDASLAQEKLIAQKAKDEWLKKQLKNVEQGLDAGLYTSMDAGRLYSDILEQESEQIQLNEEAVEVKFQLSNLLNRELPELTDIQFNRQNLIYKGQIPNYNELKTQLFENSPELKRLELEYKRAEKVLELQIRKQYPDLKIGTDWAQEVGEDKQTFGLGFGIELPIFDRNQEAITEADHNRTVIRKRYERKSAELLLQLKKSLKIAQLNQRKLQLYQDKLLVNSEKNFQEAHLAVEAGTIDLQRYWDFQEQVLNIRFSKALIIEQVYRSINNIEQIIGKPLGAQSTREQSNSPTNSQAKK